MNPKENGKGKIVQSDPYRIMGRVVIKTMMVLNGNLNCKP